MSSQNESHKKGLKLTERAIIFDISQKPDSRVPAASDTNSLRNYIIKKRELENEFWKSPEARKKYGHCAYSPALN